MNRWVANSILLGVAILWGVTFVFQKIAMQHMGPFMYTGLRFLLGACLVAPLAWREWHHLQKQGMVLKGRDKGQWVGVGVLLFLGAICQQVGVIETSVSNAGFLTALYVPLVPILGWIIHQHRPHGWIWLGVIGCFLGTFLLGGGHFTALSKGDLWVMLSTLFWAGHVLWVGVVAAQKGTPLLLACTQFAICGLGSLGMALWMEPWHWEGIQAAWIPLVWGGALSVGVGFTLQVVAQHHAPAADAAIVLSSEMLFSALAGVIWLHERLMPMQWVGGGLIFAAILCGAMDGHERMM